MAEKTIELEVKTQATDAKQQVDKLTKSLDNLTNSLSKVENSLGKNKSISGTTGKIKDSFKGVSNNKINALANSFKKMANNMYKMVGNSVDASEKLNLFNTVFENIQQNGETTFSKLGLKATQFQNKMNEAFGTNKAETMNYQALYQSLAKNMGVQDTIAEVMSEGMTQLTYDLASLYNKDVSSVATAIQSSIYSGNVRPIKNFGVDVTQNALSQRLASLGITDRSISDMSQAEKQLLRYITALEQAKVAQSDFADTINSPANQLKILKQQFTELSIAMGNLFVGAFAKILPYVNAIVMVAKELLKTLASIFGITLEDYNTSVSFNDVSDSIDGIGDSANNATKAVKELKRQTLGFDQINNLKTQSSSGSSGTGGVSLGGIDSRLLDAIKSYDNGMESVRNKATEIRDRIMEWLGFTKVIDEKTGEVSFKLKEGYANIKALLPVVVALGASYVVNKVATIYSTYKKLFSLIGTTSTTLATVNKYLGSISGLVLSLVGVYDSVSKITEKGISLLRVVEGIAGVLGTFKASSVIAGLIGGTFATALAPLASITAVLVTGATAYVNALQEIENKKLFGNISVSTEEWLNMLKRGYTTDLPLHTEELKTLKEQYVSAGSAIDSVFARIDNLAYKSKITGEQISKEDTEKIKESYKSMSDSVISTIDNETQTLYKIRYDYYSNKKLLDTSEAQLELKTILQSGNDRKESVTNNLNEIYKIMESAGWDRFKLTKEQEEKLQELINGFNKTTVESWTKGRLGIEEQMSKLKDNSDKLSKESYANLKEAFNTYKTEQMDSINSYYDEQKEALRTMLNNGQIPTLEEYNKRVKELDNERAEMTKSVEDNIADYKREVEDMLLEEMELNNDKRKKSIENVFKDLDLDTSRIDNWIKETRDKFIKASPFYVDTEVKKVDTTEAQKILESSNKFTVKAKVELDNNSLSNIMQRFKSTFTIKNLLGKEADGGIFNGTSWHPVTQYATGGLPSTGEMFVAREAGPELVGKIGSSTAVLNNNQIVASVANGVAKAVSSVLGNGSNAVEVYVHTDEGTVIDRINRKTIQTGNCPIIF